MEEGEYVLYSAETLYNAFVASNGLLQTLLEAELEKLLEGSLQFSSRHVAFISYLSSVNSMSDISRTDFPSLYFSDLRLKSYRAATPDLPYAGAM